jgi:hypothetical protein
MRGLERIARAVGQGVVVSMTAGRSVLFVSLQSLPPPGLRSWEQRQASSEVVS